MLDNETRLVLVCNEDEFEKTFVMPNSSSKVIGYLKIYYLAF